MRKTLALAVLFTAQPLGCVRTDADVGDVVMASGADSVAPTVLASGQGGPLFIALDGGYAYWSNNTTGEIMAAKATGDEPPRVLYRGQAPRRVRAAGGQVYFVDTNAGTVQKIDAATGAVTNLATGQTQPYGLTVGAGTSTVYWTNAGTQSAGFRDGAVMRRGPDDAEPTTVFASQSEAMGLDVGDTYLYWTSVVDKGVRRTNLGSSGSVVEVVATRQNGPATVAVDAANAYWTNAYDGTLMTASIATGATRKLATGTFGITNVASDGVNVYFTCSGDGHSPGTGSVKKVPVAGGTPIVIASLQDDPAGIAVDDQYVYWTDATKGTVLRRTK